MHRPLLTLAALNGLLAVALGAFGAHGLQGHLAPLEDGAQRLSWWETAAHYHLTHALAIGLAAAAHGAFGSRAGRARTSGLAFQLGIALFSGSLYTMSLTGIRWLGAVTPIGGAALLAGWGVLAWTAWRGGGTDPAG